MPTDRQSDECRQAVREGRQSRRAQLEELDLLCKYFFNAGDTASSFPAILRRQPGDRTMMRGNRLRTSLAPRARAKRTIAYNALFTVGATAPPCITGRPTPDRSR
jgi:hypothetical protein